MGGRQHHHSGSSVSTTGPVFSLSTHVHISEREPDGSWEDCTFDSGLEWYRLCHNPAVPATHAEAQAIRKASGIAMTGGGTISDLRRGIKARYGTSIPPGITGWTALWAALKPGSAAVVQGDMKAFDSTHRLSRWDKNFDGGHAIMAIRLDATDRVWWCDPLAPDTGTYNGEWVTKAELQKYVTMLTGYHLVATVITKEIAMPALTAYLPGQTITIKAGSNIRKDPSSSNTPIRALAKAETWTIFGSVKGEALAGVDVWYVRWAGGRYEYVNKNGVTAGPTAPVADDGFTKATQDAAVAAAAAKAKADEKERIAVEMGKASADAIRQS